MDGAGSELSGDASSGISADLLAACYDDVRRIARKVIATGRADRALQATELANEAAIRLMGVDRMQIKDRAHVLAMAARTMRRILIDEARKGLAAKRQTPVFITQWPDDASAELVDLNDLGPCAAPPWTPARRTMPGWWSCGSCSA